MTKIRALLVLSMLMCIYLHSEAQYVRHNNHYVQKAKKHCRYDGYIEDQFYYRDVDYVFVIGSIYKSYSGVGTLDSIKVAGNVKRGKENGLFSFHLVDGSLIAKAEMKSGKINGKVTFFLENHTIELYIKNRKIIPNPIL
ncbi:MAG: hypothetical protein PUF10_06330 [Bacteroidales bacterium]|nr:hypothetical protein [Bacteroidales bacterium]